MNLLPVDGQIRSLLELFAAVINCAGVRLEVGVPVDVLSQVVLLSEIAPADFALEFLGSEVDRLLVALQSKVL